MLTTIADAVVVMIRRWVSCRRCAGRHLFGRIIHHVCRDAHKLGPILCRPCSLCAAWGASLTGPGDERLPVLGSQIRWIMDGCWCVLRRTFVEAAFTDIAHAQRLRALQYIHNSIVTCSGFEYCTTHTSKWLHTPTLQSKFHHRVEKKKRLKCQKISRYISEFNVKQKKKRKTLNLPVSN